MSLGQAVQSIVSGGEGRGGLGVVIEGWRGLGGSGWGQGGVRGDESGSNWDPFVFP